MNPFNLLQLSLYFVLLLALAQPLGVYMARVYQGERTRLDPILRPVERLIYRALGARAEDEMDWKTYALAMLAFFYAPPLLVSLFIRAARMPVAARDGSVRIGS